MSHMSGFIDLSRAQANKNDFKMCCLCYFNILHYFLSGENILGSLFLLSLTFLNIKFL